jgi:hypothetical protein
MNGTIIAALPVAAIFGFAGYRVGTGRGRPVLGAVLGFALGLWTTPGILEAVKPGRMQGHGGTAEVSGGAA